MKMRFQKNPKATFILVHEQKEVYPLCGGKIEKNKSYAHFSRFECSSDITVTYLTVLILKT
jgi:hypothetical protein